MSNWIEIFRAGKYPQGDFNEARIRTAVDRYDPARAHAAPAVYGHPKSNSPACAWVDKLKMEDGKIFATFRDVAENFSALVLGGAYPKRSASFYETADGGLYLRHVGFLGGVPPQIKGMSDILEFSDKLDDGKVIKFEFADWNERGMWARLRDFLLARFGKDEAEAIIPQSTLDYMASDEGFERAKGIYAPPTSGENTQEVCMTEAEIKKLRDDLQAAQAAAEKNQADIAAFAEREKTFAEENARLKSEARKVEINARLDKLQHSGKVTPGMRSLGLAEFLSGCDSSTEVQFSEDVKANQAEFVFRLLEALPDHSGLRSTKFTENNANPASPDKETVEFMKKGMEGGK